MLLAEASGNVSFLLFLVIMVLGVRQWCKWLKGNDALRGAAKKGLWTVVGRIFKL